MLLTLAREWRAVAEALRDVGVPEGHPVLRVWREAAWCDVLFGRVQPDAALRSLRALVRTMTGESPPPACCADPFSEAARLFAHLRAVVSARYPRAFRRPAA